MIFEGMFNGVPAEIKQLVERQIEVAVIDAVNVVRDKSENDHKLKTCIIRISEAMMLGSAISRGTQKVAKKEAG